MKKRSYCPCGCGHLVPLTALPPRAQAMRNRRLAAERLAAMRAVAEAHFAATQRQLLGQIDAGPMQ